MQSDEEIWAEQVDQSVVGESRREGSLVPASPIADFLPLAVQTIGSGFSCAMLHSFRQTSICAASAASRVALEPA